MRILELLTLYLFYVAIITGFFALLCVYIPVSLLYELLAGMKRWYENFLETFEGWA